MRRAIAILLASATLALGADNLAELVIAWDAQTNCAYRLFWQCNSNAPASCTITNGQRVVMTNYGQFVFWLTAQSGMRTSPPSNRVSITVNPPANLTAPNLILETFKTNRLYYD
jgi:hypothetical protein